MANPDQPRHSSTGQYVPAWDGSASPRGGPVTTDQNGQHPAGSQASAILRGLAAGMQSGTPAAAGPGVSGILMNAPRTGHRGSALVTQVNRQQPMTGLAHPVNVNPGGILGMPSATVPTGAVSAPRAGLEKVTGAQHVQDQTGRPGGPTARHAAEWAATMGTGTVSDGRAVIASTMTGRPPGTPGPGTGIHRQWGQQP